MKVRSIFSSVVFGCAGINSISARAANINFLELPNEGGIHVQASQFEFFGNQDTVVPGEVAHVFASWFAPGPGNSFTGIAFLSDPDTGAWSDTIQWTVSNLSGVPSID